MRFDMAKAWDGTVAMLGKNRELLAVVAGVFFFLPQLTVQIFLGQEFAALMNPQLMADPEKFMTAFAEIYRSKAWMFLPDTVLQVIGMLAIMFLLTSKDRPTLGESLKLGVKGLIPYILVNLVLILAAIIVAFLAVTLIFISKYLAILLIPLVIAASFYLLVKLSMIIPVIAVERHNNPITILKSCWAVTKGNSLRICLFYCLLLILSLVIMIIISLISGALFGWLGMQTAMIAGAITSALLSAAYAVISTAVFASTYRQLSDADTTVSEAFE